MNSNFTETETPIITLQRFIRIFLARYNLQERKVAISNSIAKLTNSPVIGMIVVYNFDNKMGIVLYKEIDENNRLKSNFIFMLKSYLPPKYIPHRDHVTFSLINNPKKPEKKMAEIITITKRSPFGYINLTRQNYTGTMTISKKQQILLHFKFHQMSYRAIPESNNTEEILKCQQTMDSDEKSEVRVNFNLNARFRAINITNT
jgi:hypothetical protein